MSEQSDLLYALNKAQETLAEVQATLAKVNHVLYAAHAALYDCNWQFARAAKVTIQDAFRPFELVQNERRVERRNEQLDKERRIRPITPVADQE